MNDCPRAEVRDRLPDLVHGRVEGHERAAIASHVATCAECRAELELLRGLHGMFMAEPAHVDVARIVAAVPSRRVGAIRPGRPQGSWFDWRIAAAAAMLLVGGGSVVVYDRVGASGAARTASIAETDSQRSHDSAPSVGLGLSGRLTDLDDHQLEALLNDIENMQAVPIAEPDPVSIQIDANGTVAASRRGGA